MVKNPVTIRTFVPEDMDIVIDLLQEVSAYRPVNETAPTLAKAFADQANSYGCVALQDGQVIGFGSIFILNRLRGGRSAIVEDIVVTASMRGNGIGRSILNTLSDIASARGCFKVTLEASQSAERFYCSAGFVKSGRVMKLML